MANKIQNRLDNGARQLNCNEKYKQKQIHKFINSSKHVRLGQNFLIINFRFRTILTMEGMLDKNPIDRFKTTI